MLVQLLVVILCVIGLLTALRFRDPLLTGVAIAALVINLAALGVTC